MDETVKKNGDRRDTNEPKVPDPHISVEKQMTDALQPSFGNETQTHSTSHQDKAVSVGTILVGRYELLGILGQGGMGTVYKAHSLINGQLRAVKVLRPDLIGDSDALRRFEQEARAAARVMHPNAIRVIDNGVDPAGNPFLVMEYADGQSLSSVLKREGKLPFAIALKIFRQICDALSVAHANGVIHRDMKPSNVLIIDTPSEPFFVKVLDFGIAKVLPRGDDGTVAVTATGAVLGSPPYMSPEQCLGQELDYRSDIYSFGCLMYEVLTGAAPLLGDTPMSTMYKQINEVALPLTGLKEDLRLVDQVDRIISKAMQKSPSRRYTSFEDIMVDLDAAFQKSNQTSSLLAATAMQLRAAVREISNRLGSSRKLTLVTLFIFLFASIPLSCILAPFAFIKPSNAKFSNFPWQSSPHWSTASFNTRRRFDIQEAELKRKLASKNLPKVEEAAACRQLADMYFDDVFYDQAAVRYNQLAVLDSLRLQEKHRDTGELPALMHEDAYALSRYARCLVHHHDYASALKQAKLGQKLSFYDSTGDSKYQIYFAQVIGVSTVMLTHQSTALTNDYLEKFVQFIDEKGYAPERTSELAQTVAEIGDCYFLTGQWERAIKTYEKAETYWKSVANPGNYEKQKDASLIVTDAPRGGDERAARLFARRGDFAAFNIALAEMKIGEAQAKLGDFASAKNRFETALVWLEQWGGPKSEARVQALLQLADRQWNHRDYIASLANRIQSLKILKESGGR